MKWLKTVHFIVDDSLFAVLVLGFSTFQGRTGTSDLIQGVRSVKKDV